MSNVSRIGACVSDLVANVHALVTENETEGFLDQRIYELRATAVAIMGLAEQIGEERGRPVRNGK